MLKPSINEVLDKIDNRYYLVGTVAKRAREIIDGSTPYVENKQKEIPKEVFSVKDKVDYIRSVLLDRGFVSFFELFSMNVSRNELITTFQATLELLKLQYIKVEQKDLFGDITLLLREDRNEEIGEIDEYN